MEGRGPLCLSGATSEWAAQDQEEAGGRPGANLTVGRRDQQGRAGDMSFLALSFQKQGYFQSLIH